jgi:hypothetical protein
MTRTETAKEIARSISGDYARARIWTSGETPEPRIIKVYVREMSARSGQLLDAGHVAIRLDGTVESRTYSERAAEVLRRMEMVGQIRCR